ADSVLRIRATAVAEPCRRLGAACAWQSTERRRAAAIRERTGPTPSWVLTIEVTTRRRLGQPHPPSDENPSENHCGLYCNAAGHRLYALPDLRGGRGLPAHDEAGHLRAGQARPAAPDAGQAGAAAVHP